MNACTYSTVARPYTVELRPHGNTGQHRYYVTFPDGTSKQLARVTTILATLAKPALIPWAAKMAVEAALEKLEPGVAYTENQLVAILEWARDAHQRTKEEAASHGTRAHELIEAYLHSGQVPDLEREDPHVQNCFALFEEFWQSNAFQVVDLEAYVADVNLGYGGTVDALVRDRHGRLVLLDWKTSKAVYPEMQLQVVAYGAAMAAMGLGMPDSASIVRIGKEDAEFEVVEVWSDLERARSHYQAWKALVAVTGWLRETNNEMARLKRAAEKAAKAEKAAREQYRKRKEASA